MTDLVGAVFQVRGCRVSRHLFLYCGLMGKMLYGPDEGFFFVFFLAAVPKGASGKESQYPCAAHTGAPIRAAQTPT